MKITRFQPSTAGSPGGGGATGPAGGDLGGGGYPSPQVIGIDGKPISGSAVVGDVLVFDGTNWIYSLPAGDLEGTWAATVVAKIRGVAVSATPPVAGQSLLATGAATAAWGNPAASTLSTRWEPMTNGDPSAPEIVFDGTGDVVMVEVAL